MTRISVVVPVYNSEDTIEECIKSILSQTVNDIELVLVNDGSKDNSGDVCDKYAEEDNRTKVIHQKNKGRSEARSVGVKAAKGEWICFVDSDDTLPVDALELLIAKASDSCDIVFGNGYTLPGEHREVIPIDEFRHLAVRAEGTIGVPWGSLYRRKKLTDWMFNIPKHIYNGEDYLFWLRLVFNTELPVRVVYEKVYNKGAEHTSNSFTWTADYCYELNELRKASIPSEQHSEYLADMLCDRMENLYATAVYTPRSEWKHSRYYADIITDMQKCGRSMTLRNRLFLNLPSRRLRKLLVFNS